MNGKSKAFLDELISELAVIIARGDEVKGTELASELRFRVAIKMAFEAGRQDWLNGLREGLSKHWSPEEGDLMDGTHFRRAVKSRWTHAWQSHSGRPRTQEDVDAAAGILGQMWPAMVDYEQRP